MKSIAPCASAALALLAVICAPTALAVPITFQAVANVTGIENSGGLITSVFGTVPAATLVTYTWSFEPGTPDGFPGIAETGLYAGALTAASLTVGSTTLPLTLGVGQGITVQNNFFLDNRDAYAVNNATTTVSGVNINPSFFFYTNGASAASPATVVNTDALIVDPATIMSFSNRNFELLLSNATDVDHVQLHVSSITQIATPVPLPAALWLLVSGVGGLGALARRRSVNSRGCSSPAR